MLVFETGRTPSLPNETLPNKEMIVFFLMAQIKKREIKSGSRIVILKNSTVFVSESEQKSSSNVDPLVSGISIVETNLRDRCQNIDCVRS